MVLHSSSIHISDSFCGGNIALQKCVSNGSVSVHLQIKQDPYTDLEQKHHSQYFCFRSSINDVENGPIDVTYVVDNAAEVSFPSAWNDYTVFVS